MLRVVPSGRQMSTKTELERPKRVPHRVPHVSNKQGSLLLAYRTRTASYSWWLIYKNLQGFNTDHSVQAKKVTVIFDQCHIHVPTAQEFKGHRAGDGDAVGPRRVFAWHRSWRMGVAVTPPAAHGTPRVCHDDEMWIRW